ncbi:MAG: Fe-Mn family superoxide dismutase [Pseudomonadota bacterium]
MDYQIQALTLNLDTLNGLSSKLISSHHENNYTGAVKRLNAIRSQLDTLAWDATPVFVINGLKREELIAANSAYLHELYFDAMGGDGVLPSSGLTTAFERDFGSVARWQAEFVGMAKAMGGGSGWAMLSWSPREGRLINHWAADHTHLLAGAIPVLALDMYEHAYHMDFGAKAAAYVDAFMKNIRWDATYRRYGAAVAGSAVSCGADIKTLGDTAENWVILDVRRTEHLAQAHDTIAGAVWRDPAKVGEWSGALDSTKPVVVCCVHGLDIGRSTAMALRAKGVNATYLIGGIEAWRNAGLPLQPKAV